MGKTKEILTNPWTIAIVAPIVTLIIIKAIDLIFVTSILSGIINILLLISKNIFNFLTAKYEWELYQLVLLFLAGPLIGIFVIWIFSKFEKSEVIKEPEWFNYKNDIFENVSYKWEWDKGRDGTYHVSSIRAYCIKCNCQIIHERCPNCKSTYYNKVKPDYEIETLILHRIELKGMN